MKQCLGIAIALIGKPELMILDEPINGLWILFGIKEFRLMISATQSRVGNHFIISSHILSELYLVATVWRIDQGRLVAEFTKDDFDRAKAKIISSSKLLMRPGCQPRQVYYQLKEADKSDELHIVAQEKIQMTSTGSWSHPTFMSMVSMHFYARFRKYLQI